MFWRVIRHTWKPLLPIAIIGKLGQVIGVTFFAESSIYLWALWTFLIVGIGLSIRFGIIRAKIEKKSTEDDYRATS